MSVSKLSINRACAVGAVFLGVISASTIVAAVLLTKNSAVVWLGLLFAVLVFACATAFVAFLRHKLVLFSDNLCRTIDDMLDGAAAPPQIYEEENLFYKINHRLARLYEVLRENRESISKERADLQELISDISHHHRPDMGVVYVSGAILLLAFSVLVVRYASANFPAVKPSIKQQPIAGESHEGIEPN